MDIRGRSTELFLADDPVAADATCARLMGLDPTRITHIRIGAQFFSANVCNERIDQVAEAVCAPRQPHSKYSLNLSIFV